MPRKTPKLLILIALLLISTHLIITIQARLEPIPEIKPPRENVPAVPSSLLAALDEAPILTEGAAPLRKFPYPYQAMLAIISDCDDTTPETFESVHRFLNTFEQTEYGVGIGLDIADSFFFYNGSDYSSASGLMSYCEGTGPDTLRNGALIKKYYDCGWIDSLHTFGDFSSQGQTLFTRALGLRAWDILSQAGITPSVWIDHGTDTNTQNFGAYIPGSGSDYQSGDDPESAFYHTDVTLSHIRYVWHSRHSSIFGRDYPLEVKSLRDGQKVWGFARYTHEIKEGAIDWNWRPNRLRDQLRDAHLDALIQNKQYGLMAQHITQQQNQMEPADVAALRKLAHRAQQDRSILVARTSRLLNYAVTWKYLTFQVAERNGFTAIRLLSIADPVGGGRPPRREDLAGMTFYCADPQRTALFMGDTPVAPEDIIPNPPDETGRPSVSLPWFPVDTVDYTQIP